ncbi:hypothetical protein ACIQYS_12455 [Psychrobacillus sp. NPDC096426]|uniref:hypothetical protein n=1 Tax=Psychrobacillus sp. NPDC096426 TaxID=3364491 RepID=UPI003829282B
MIPEDPYDGLPPNLALSIEVLGSAIISIGFIVNTIAAGVELYEANRDDKVDERAARDQKRQVSEMQNKLDSLLDQMEAMKKEKDECRNCSRHKRG